MSKKRQDKKTSAKGNERRIRKSVLIVAIVLIAAAAVTAAYLYERSSPPLPWLFNGAYGVYDGNYTSSNESYGITSRLEVTGFNSTTATLTQMITLNFANGTQSQPDNVTRYYDIQGRYLIVNDELTNGTNGGYINYNSSERPCLVYEYVAILGDGSIATTQYYYDNATGWMLGWKENAHDYNMTLNLMETNVPGLN
jgi:hypothetical protein